MSNEITTTQQAETAALTGGVLARLDSAETMGRIAKLLSTSKIVPQLFKEDAGACMLALNMAQNVKCDPFQLMQNIYDVHGRIGISGQFCVALLKANPEYSSVKYEFVNGVDWKGGIRVVATSRETGERIIGTAITPDMVNKEGWGRNSKWQTMGEQMYKYRAAAFFVRANCPNLLFGMQTTEELRDITMQEPAPRSQRRVYSRREQDTAPISAPAADEIPGLEPPAEQVDELPLVFGTATPEPSYRD